MVSVLIPSRSTDELGKVKLPDFGHSEMNGLLLQEVRGLVRQSKNGRYEIPYNVTGIIKLTGVYQGPKCICKDSDNGTQKAQNMEILLSMKQQ